jgi:hypothetical protein
MNDNQEYLAISLPDQNNFELAYSQAFDIAVDKLASTFQIEILSQRSNGEYISECGQSWLKLMYLNDRYQIHFPDITITRVNDPSPVELRDKILILHYLLNSSDTPLSGKLISFKELGEALPYYRTFYQRTIQPLIKHFGNDLFKLESAVLALGAVRIALGDYAVTIPAFHNIPITLVFWHGDDEFPPDVNILFDSTVLNRLPLEDLIVLCQTIVWRMIKSV